MFDFIILFQNKDHTCGLLLMSLC